MSQCPGAERRECAEIDPRIPRSLPRFRVSSRVSLQVDSVGNHPDDVLLNGIDG